MAGRVWEGALTNEVALVEPLVSNHEQLVTRGNVVGEISEKLENYGATKVLNYKDAVYFRVPIKWLVASEGQDEIAIYEDREGSGTLRPWTEEYTFDDTAPRDLAVGDLHAGRPTEVLNDRATLSYTVLDQEEDGELLRLHKWIVTIPVGDRRLRVVTFNHTVDAISESSDDANLELQVVNMAVRSALYPDANTDNP